MLRRPAGPHILAEKEKKEKKNLRVRHQFTPRGRLSSFLLLLPLHLPLSLLLLSPESFACPINKPFDNEC